MAELPRQSNGEADITLALSRALGALANAQSAVASLGTAVGTAQKAAERAEREAQRLTIDARTRIDRAELDAGTLRAELAKARETGNSEAERRAYRRGYSAGHSAAARGKPADPEGTATTGRPRLKAAS